MKLALLAVGFIVATTLILGEIDHRSAIVTASHERAAAEKKADVKPADKVWMRLPLECETWIAQCSAGKPCKRRYNCAADLTRREKK